MDELLNCCPKCGSTLEFSNLMQYSDVYKITRSGKLSKKRIRKEDCGPMECGASWPLLETTIKGATHVIINISGDISLMDANDAAEELEKVRGDEEADVDADDDNRSGEVHGPFRRVVDHARG